MELRSELRLITQLMEELATGRPIRKETSQPPGHTGPARRAAGFIFILFLFIYFEILRYCTVSGLGSNSDRVTLSTDHLAPYNIFFGPV
jgi:hypothetical protein